MLETDIDESDAQIQSDSLLEGSKYISEFRRDGEEESDCEYVHENEVNNDEGDDLFDDESDSGSDDDENEE